MKAITLRGRGNHIGGQRAGQGRGFGKGRGGGDKPGSGPGGSCICPSCGERVTHQVGSRCRDQKCPKCGTPMTRE